jgi:hypothetical protein
MIGSSIWEFKLRCHYNEQRYSLRSNVWKSLRAYRGKNGHCNVQQQNPVQGQWVHGQRNQSRELGHGKKSLLTTEKFKFSCPWFQFGREWQTVSRKTTNALVKEHGYVDGDDDCEDYDKDYSVTEYEAEEYSSNDMLHVGIRVIPQPLLS